MPTDLNPVKIEFYLPRSDKDLFAKAAWLNDRTMAQLLREFVRNYNAQNGHLVENWRHNCN